VSHEPAAHDLREYFVLNPARGWRSKCWPAERYGELHRQLAEQYNVRGVVTLGPGEEELAQQIIRAAGNPVPVALALELGPLMAALRRAKFVVSADTGPLHLAFALKTPVVGLFGSTDPARNGPYSTDDVVVRNPQFGETTYCRGASYSPAMLSISFDQVVEAVQRRLGLRS
jgi:heptosyltransferase I